MKVSKQGFLIGIQSGSTNASSRVLHNSDFELLKGLPDLASRSIYRLTRSIRLPTLYMYSAKPPHAALKWSEGQLVCPDNLATQMTLIASRLSFATTRTAEVSR